MWLTTAGTKSTKHGANILAYPWPCLSCGNGGQEEMQQRKKPVAERKLHPCRLILWSLHWIRFLALFTDTQVPNISSMPNKWFQVFYYVFLVVPSLDFMLEVKSSQKLTVPSVPIIENVDISWKNQCFSHFSVIFIGCCMVKCVQLAFDLIWPPAWSPDLVPPEKHSKTLKVIYWAYWRYSGPVRLVISSKLGSPSSFALVGSVGLRTIGR